MKTVSARQANPAFSPLLAEAAAGEEIVITRRGKPVAKLGPVAPEGGEAAREAAVRRMTRRMKRGVHLGGIKVPRDEIYQP